MPGGLGSSWGYGAGQPIDDLRLVSARRARRGSPDVVDDSVQCLEPGDGLLQTIDLALPRSLELTPAQGTSESDEYLVGGERLDQVPVRAHLEGERRGWRIVYAGGHHHDRFGEVGGEGRDEVES